jgi:PKD repeat protein
MKTRLWLFLLIFSQAVFGQNISRIEYFFNTDPGHGNGTPLSFLPGTDVLLTDSINVGGLPKGVHNLYFRCQAGAAWSQTYSRIIALSSDEIISAAEYFFNSDPGFGNGFPIAFSPGKIVDLSFAANSSGLSTGIHSLNVRFKSDGWSQTYSRLFGVSTDEIISYAEYFFDTDPGYGNGTAIVFTPGQTVDLNFAANSSGLSTGIHSLNVRFKSDGWSQTYSRLFGVSTDEIISYAEYFFDTDPGYGNGTAIVFTPGQTVDLNFAANTTGLSTGIHSLNVRFKSDGWSQTYSRLFGVSKAEIITYAEYFFNTDPGYGNGISIPITPGQSVDLNLNANTSGLDAGVHTLNFRFKSEGWSQTYSRFVAVSRDAPVVAAEYFYNTDPGFGNGNAIPLITGNYVLLDFNAYNAALPRGKNTFFIRSKSKGWSQTFSQEVCFNPLADFSTDTVCIGNATAFTNLTADADTFSAFNWDVNNDGTIDYSGNQNFFHTYSSPGNYTARLTTGIAGECMDTVVRTVVVKPLLPVSASVAGSSAALCSGETLSLNATTVNQGINPVVQWYVNDTLMQSGGDSLIYVPMHHDSIRVLIISDEQCAVNNPFTSSAFVPTVFPLPQLSINAPSGVCHNASPFSPVGNPSGGVFGGQAISGNQFIPALAIPGLRQYSYTYTDTNNCTDSLIANIQVFQTPNVTFFGLPSGTCLNASINSLTGFPAGGIFSGSGITGNLFNPAAAGTGLHAIVYTYTDTNACTSADTQYVQVHPVPIVSFANPVNVCENASAFPLSGGSPVGGSYSGTGVFNNSFYPMAAGSGTHQLVYTFISANGCVNSDTASITVIAPPSAAFNAPLSSCQGDTLGISYTGNAAASAAYTWNFSGGTVVGGSGQGPYQVTFPLPGIKQISLIVTENSCTSAPYTDWVVIHSAEAFISSAGGTSFCEGDSLMLIANAAVGNIYQWFRNDTLMPSATGSFFYARQSGNYRVKVTNANNCSALSSVFTAMMHPLPQAAFSLVTNACIGDTVTISYTGSASSSAVYNWNLAAGFLTGGSAQGPLQVVWQIAGNKTINLQVIENGCFSTIASQTIAINTTPANLTAPGSTTICDGDSVLLLANSGLHLRYKWLLDNQEIHGASLAYMHAGQSGTYQVMVTDTLSACAQLSNPVSINVNSSDFNLAFTASSTSLSVQPFLVAFSNQTPGMQNYYYIWDFGDGHTSTFNSPFHQYLYNGSYSVGLFAQNMLTGCRDTLIKAQYITCSGGGGNPCNLSTVINQGGSVVVCPGDSLLLTANVSGAQGALSYAWFRDGILLSGVTTPTLYASLPGIYRVIVQDTVCGYTSPAFVVALYPVVKPQIVAIGSITPCSNDSMQLLTTTSYTAYHWSNGASSPTVYVSQSGHYTLTATDANNCQQQSDPYTVNASLVPPPPICLVGVDSNSHNTIVWERPITNQIDSFYIWRETTVANVYQRIGGTAYNDFTAFTDINANPAQRAWRYRLTAIDTCGQESPMSPIHKTMHLTINKGLPGTWNLIWDHYLGFNFGSYAIYRGSDSTNLSLLTMIQSNLNSYTDLNPPSDTVFYQIEIVNPFGCNPTKAMNYNTSRSNQANNMALIVIDTTGIQSIKGVNFDMNIFPNPNNGNFVLSLNSRKAGSMEAVLLNALGQAVYSERFEISGRMQRELSLEHLPKGVYFLRVSTGEGSRVMKVVINAGE